MNTSTCSNHLNCSVMLPMLKEEDFDQFTVKLILLSIQINGISRHYTWNYVMGLFSPPVNDIKYAESNYPIKLT